MNVFDSAGSCMISRDSAEGKQTRKIMDGAKNKVRLHERNGVYMMPLWLQAPADKKVTPFQGRGK